MKRLFLLASVVVACGGSDGNNGDDGGTLPGQSPPKRSDIKGAMDPDTGKAVIFGGDDGPIVDQIAQPSYRGDTWTFDPEQGWSQVNGTGPSARGRHTVAYDLAGKRMLLFGGRWRQAGTTGNYTLYNDLWAFDVAQQTWTQLHDGLGMAPPPRYFAVSAYDPNSGHYYVYGGNTNPSALVITAATDLWRFDGAAWTQMASTGTPPTPRLFQAYAYDDRRNRLVTFGGQPGDFISAALNDLHALDLGTSTWTMLDAGTGIAPRGRFSALMTYDASGDRYVVMGGHADPGVTNDVWTFSASAGWRQTSTDDQFTGAALGCLGNPREIPEGYVTQDLSSPERRSGGFLGATGDTLWLFGGESDCSDHLDDTWRFDLNSATWTEALAATSGESCARRGDDCTCLCL